MSPWAGEVLKPNRGRLHPAGPEKQQAREAKCSTIRRCRSMNAFEVVKTENISGELVTFGCPGCSNEGKTNHAEEGCEKGAPCYRCSQQYEVSRRKQLRKEVAVWDKRGHK